MTMEEKIVNIIDLLLERDLTDICFQIFNYLDNISFTNSRTVCHIWKKFIDYYFYGTPKGKKYLSQRVISNFFNENHYPKIIKKDLISNLTKRNACDKDRVTSIQCDSISISISTYSGSVSNYKFHSLEALWNLKLCDYSIKHCMNQERIFAVTSGRAVYGNLFIIDRTKGQVIYKILDIHPRGINNVKIFQNKILASTDHWGNIKFHYIKEFKPNSDFSPHGIHAPEIEIINQEETYPKIKYEPEGRCT